MKHYQHRHSQRQRSYERALDAELNRPLTQTELDDLQEEIREAMGGEEEIEEDEINTRTGKHHYGKLRLVWVNPVLARRRREQTRNRS